MISKVSALKGNQSVNNKKLTKVVPCPTQPAFKSAHKDVFVKGCKK